MLNAISDRFNKGQRAMGWAAVVLSALLGAFLGMFAGGEGVTEGWGALLTHLAQALVVVLLALAAVRWPRVGGSLLVLAGIGVAIAFHANPFAVFLYSPLMVMGLLYFFGRPSPRKTAYAVIVGAPALVTVLTALVGVLELTFFKSGL